MKPSRPSHLLALGCLLGTLLFAGTAHATGPIAQARVDAAVAEGLSDFAPVTSTNWTGTRPFNVKSTRAAHLLAVTAWHDPNATATNGTLVRNRLLDHLRRYIQAGKEPSANGGIDGWSHGAVAHTILLARNTSAVWNSLTTTERTKLDWLMRAMAIGAHWCFDDGNNYKTGLDLLGTFDKNWDNNITEGYMGVIIAASMYFGATTLNNHFTSFSYDTYVNQFNTWGWTNITTVWAKAGKSRMENGGSDGRGGSGSGVRNTFTYANKSLGDIMGLLEERINRTHPHTVTNTGANGQAYILNNGSSPTLGFGGMIQEFNHTDGSGPRSDALYAYETWMNSVPTRTSVQLLGYWAAGSSSLRTAIHNRMYNGATDLIYKLTQGYRSYSNGTTRTITATSNTANTNDTPVNKGYLYVREIWDKVLQSTPAPADTTPPSVPTGLSATNLTSTSFTLNWNASTDTGGSGLAGYSVFRGTDDLTDPTLITGTSYNVTGLTAGTTYSMRVSASDNASNESAQSSALNVTTTSGGGGSNLVTNAGFETGSLSPWTGTQAYISGVRRTGNHGARIGTSSGSAGTIQQTVSVQPNSSYTLTAWIRLSASGSSATLGADGYGGSTTASSVTSTAWTQRSVTFTTGGSATTVRIYLTKPANSGQLGHLDDVSLTQN